METAVPESSTPPIPAPHEPKRPILDRLKMALDCQTGRYHRWTAKHCWLARSALIVSLAAVGCLGWFVYDILTGLPGRQELRSIRDMSQATTIYDSSDRRLFTIPTEYRIEVPLSRMSPNLIHALVAVEDQRFYEHEGIDGFRVVAAAFNNLRERRAAEGGSTITQQLTRQTFLSSDKTLRRKLKEAILAQRIEHLYSKDEILEFYLNRTYFGDGLYGAEAAARGYFGKRAADLTIPEAAMLAGLVRAPSTTNPTVNLAKAVARRNVVLQLMLEQKVIDRATFERAAAEPVKLHDALRAEDPIGLHFKEQVRRQLIDQFGKESVVDGNLRVFTTIDPAMQRAAEAAVTQTLGELETRAAARLRRSSDRREAPLPESGDDRLQAALVVLDPTTGEVRAIVGGRDPAVPGINRAIQTRRQPGSAFKPFVYAAALESGYSPASLIEQLDQPIELYKKAWLPDDHSTGSAMTIRTALRTSSNRAAVQMLQQVGIERTVTLAQRMGIGSLPNVPSLALGAGEVTLMSMTSAYSAFAHEGVVEQPTFIRRVEGPDGSVLFAASSKRQRVLSETTAFLMSSMLANVIDAGTASNARALGFTLHAAGKTGTTNDFKDAWFIGYTPKLIAGVWVGFDQPRTIMRNGYAAALAVPLWTRFMKATLRKSDDVWFTPPPGVVTAKICRISGKLATPECANVMSVGRDGDLMRTSAIYTEYFARGTDPSEECPVHGVLDGWDSAIATAGFDLPMPASTSPEPLTLAPVPDPHAWPFSTAAPTAFTAAPASPAARPATDLLSPPEERPSAPAAPLPQDSQIDKTVDPPPQ